MLRIENLSFSYGKLQVLENINLRIQPGEQIAIVGESGCGKSTLLKIIYGLMDLEEGKVSWEDEPVLGPAFHLVPGAKYMKYLSQDFDLMPFLSVADNVSQYLSVFYPEELKERTQELLEMIELTEIADKKVKLLSGGQQQRVALARVLAQKPEVLLLDEPFGHIDNFLKNSLRRNMFKYLRKNGITTLVATHDVNDVLPFADRAVVLRNMHIIANARPMELYQNPKTLYVASLFGEASMISIDVLKTDANTKRKIIVYAHEFRVTPSSGLPVIVEKAYPMGSHYLTESVGPGNEVVFFNAERLFPKGKEVFLNVAIETINQRIQDASAQQSNPLP